MRVLVVSDRFGPGLPASGAAQQLAQGWRRSAPDDEVGAVGLSDGSLGFVDAVAAATGTRPTPLVVEAPDGFPTPAELVLTVRDGVLTAYVEAAQAAGRHLVDDPTLAEPDPLTSLGVADLLLAARDGGARRIVLGVGDLACHDAGLGMLQRLGAGDWLDALGAVRTQWADVQLVLAHATDRPLLGFHGASAALGTEHGVAGEVTQRLEARTGRLVDRVAQVDPVRRDLLTGLPIRREREPGSGAGGGLGYALLLLGAQAVPGARLLLDDLGLAPRLPGALVVTATLVYDWRTVQQGVVAETARAAAAVGSPVVVLADEVAVGRREGMSLGVSGAYDVRVGEDLAALAARVARTWSPRR